MSEVLRWRLILQYNEQVIIISQWYNGKTLCPQSKVDGSSLAAAWIKAKNKFF